MHRKRLMDQAMIEELVNGLKSIYADNLVSIILYGSVARGTNTEESDIDVAVILMEDSKRRFGDGRTIKKCGSIYSGN